MRTPRPLWAAVAAMMFTTTFSQSLHADTLTLGDKAPALAVDKWVQGEPVKEFEKGKIYIVEFWATWCGPCRATIPHINDLSKKYKDKVTVIGVNVWEEELEKVEPFIKEMGEKMTYRVATDLVPKDSEPSNGKMAKTWMTAAAQDGIPAAFIVNGEGNIVWIGHPAEMDKPLAKIVDGSYDLAAAVKEAKKAKELEGKMTPAVKKLQKAIGSGDHKTTVEAIDELIEIKPELELQLGPQKFKILLYGLKDVKGASALAEKLMTQIKGLPPEVQILNMVAWTIVDPDAPKYGEPDLDLALKAATRASELSKNADPAILDTVALIHFKKGDAKKALELQEKAVKLGKDSKLEGIEDMEKRLKEYREAAKEKS